MIRFSDTVRMINGSSFQGCPAHIYLQSLSRTVTSIT